MCLVIYACKCDVPKDKLKADMYEVFDTLFVFPPYNKPVAGLPTGFLPGIHRKESVVIIKRNALDNKARGAIKARTSRGTTPRPTRGLVGVHRIVKVVP